jgi:hypothetical protein
VGALNSNIVNGNPGSQTKRWGTKRCLDPGE